MADDRSPLPPADVATDGSGTEQVTPGPDTAVPMGSSGMSGAGPGAFASSADVEGDPERAFGAVSATGRRLRLRFPDAPGGNASPQAPGARPDFSTIPGERVARSPRVESVHHPATESGTAEGIMGFFDLAEGEADDQERFELGMTSFEEQRKAQPALRTPVRPGHGISGLGEPAWQREAPALPAGDDAAETHALADLTARPGRG